ncbi:hypothetical protein BHE90_005295 [Fusarium euwallaceae]|uniref:Glycosyltransferase family 28 N-terminal domain-containing protein n=1 Tax=Fusarium euwallaceae TaxID=1147111 RepID=A0A430LWW9_9HYPO|nr:hypothetical protein BHE90_005295 [Fusarium euwallaceae]
MARRKVLMLTNYELGQANVFIATSHALLERDPNIELHIASFPQLEKTLNLALAKDGQQLPINFHSFPGRTMFVCLNSSPDPSMRLFSLSLLKPGLWSAPQTIRFIMTWAFLCWTAEEFTAIFNKICTLIETIQPDIVLIDPIFSPGITAGKHMKSHVSKEFTLTILSPNSMKDYVHHVQPRGAPFWKWSVAASGIPTPVPWYYIPLNIYHLFRFIIIIAGDNHKPTMTAKVRELTNIPQLELVDILSMLHTGLDGIDRILISSRPEIDFPFLDFVGPPKAYMDKIFGCGPILRPLERIDGDLAAWLSRGPVIYINLGTHCLTSEPEAVEMARSLKNLIDRASSKHKLPRLQVLWKLKKDLERSGDYHVGPGSAVYEVLSNEIDRDRVRIMSWVASEPSSILETGNVVCAVSHGGANSYNEAICSGVPQVVLPCWFDCYDFASKAELLGIGRWGSRKGCPRWIESELTEVLIDVALDNNAEYTAKSRSLAELCGRNGGGRATAAGEILRIIDDQVGHN